MSEAHDVDGRLVPPVEHQHHQDMPQLVAGPHVVHLTWKRVNQVNYRLNQVNYRPERVN